MASEISGTPKMIVQYEWILENVEEEPKTIASKMILFRGARVFRVGLKNHVESPVLFFMAIDLNKIGMKVEGVTYGSQGSGIVPPTMWEMDREKIGDDGNLQLFTIELSKQIVGKCTFVFRICIEGSVPEYSYQLSDRLAKEQLWAAAKNKNSVDVQFVVKGNKFSAHKAILSARSPVFAAEFMNEQPEGAVGLHQIHIGSVEPFTVEQFLHFIYTGESMGTLANEELLILADRYQLSTLANLCRVALRKIETTQMVSLTNSLHNNSETPSSTVKPEKDTEIFFDGTTPTFRCALSFIASESGKSKCMMQYQNEDIFIAYFSGGTVKNMCYGLGYGQIVSKPVFHFSSFKHRRFGLKVEDVYCKQDHYKNWSKMESKVLQKNAELLLHFTTQSEPNVHFSIPTEVSFDIKIVSSIKNYYYEMMEGDWMDDFWFAASIQFLTDVEIFVGTVKLMEAHRVILSARSAVLNALLSKISNTRKSIVTFGAEFDVNAVKHFLMFLYTGSLETSASKFTNYKQLLKLATMYEVETLKIFCQLVDSAPPDVEELTDCLLQL